MERKRQPSARRLLGALNVFGLDHLDPVILAALADERPLLLVGPHGTAKSELLNRLAAALGLDHRHYNASLIAFDDLLGFPLPNAKRTALEYLRTPGDLWGAESVFIDELSRCRPEHQNKLFSIVHERRVQGLELERLRYRWAAMNPPISLDGSDWDAGEHYQGSLPLDPALADRFPYVAEVPAFLDLEGAVRRRLIEQGGAPPAAAPDVAGLVSDAKARCERLGRAPRRWIADYVHALAVPLGQAGLAITGRRAVSLAGTVASVHAARGALGLGDSLPDAALLALKCGLPQRAQGIAVREEKLRAAHRIAVEAATVPGPSVRGRIAEEPDPVRRIAFALGFTAKECGKSALAQLVTDAWAGLDVPGRYALSSVLLPVLARRDRVTAAAYELLAEPLGKVLKFAEGDEHQITIPRSRAKEWDRVLATVNALRKRGHPETIPLANLLYTLFAVERAQFDPDQLVERHDAWRALFGPEALGEAA